MRRPTIRDIAQAAGVSPGAVSFALNGQRGVSEATRERVRRVADELGWTPSAAARALSANRANAVGLVIARPTESISSERFFLRFIAGVEQVLTAQALSLVLQLVSTADEEGVVYRHWWAARRVDGVILTDPRHGDPRPEHLMSLGLPSVMVGAPEGAWGHLPIGTVATADAAAMRLVVEHLHATGRRRLAYVSGLAGLVHLESRRRAFGDAALALGLDETTSVSTDFTEDAGADTTRTLLGGGGERPDAIVYDNELLALGGMVAINELGLRVPQDVAIVSFEDSPVCRVVNPPLTALRRDPADLGRDAAELLLEAIGGATGPHRTAPVPTLQVRGSSAPR